ARSMHDLSNDALIALLEQPNNWYVRKARRILGERHDASTYAALRKLVAASGDAQVGLEAFWALYVAGGADEAYLRAQLSHASPRVRKWAVRLLGDAESRTTETEQALVVLAGTEPDAKVRSQLASTAARLRATPGLAVVQAIALQDRDATDPFVSLLLWWA